MLTALFEIENAELDAIYQEIDAADGVVTDEQWDRIIEIMAEEQGLIDNAAEVKNLEEVAESAKKWIAKMQARRNRILETAGRLRGGMSEPLQTLLPSAHLPKGKKSIVGQAGALRVGLRQNHKGTVDPNDPALDSEKSLKGYEKEQVAKSGIAGRYFIRKEVWVLDKEKLAEDLRLAEGMENRPKELGAARMDYSPSVVITVVGGSS